MQTQLREPRKKSDFRLFCCCVRCWGYVNSKKATISTRPKTLVYVSVRVKEYYFFEETESESTTRLTSNFFFCFLFTTNIVYSNWHKVQFTFIQYITLNRMYITYLSSFVPPHILHANLFWVNKLRKSHFYSMTFFLSFFCRHSNANREEKLIAFLLWEDSFLLLTWLYGGGGE